MDQVFGISIDSPFTDFGIDENTRFWTAPLSNAQFTCTHTTYVLNSAL